MAEAEPRPVARIRSVLFVPGNRPDMIAKIPRYRPDVAVADLEDAVTAGDKGTARLQARAALAALAALAADCPVLLIRVNPVGSPWFDADVDMAAASAAAGVVVPKLAGADDVRQVNSALGARGRMSAVVIGGLETAAGVADAREVSAQGLSAVYFGAEDYVADVGGRRSKAGDEVLYARSQVALAARLGGIPAIDQAVVDFRDASHFLADARAGACIGYQGKTCIHPRQVELAHQAFTPSPAEVAHARAILDAGQSGTGVVDGQMIDDVHVRMAQALLARAGHDAGRPGGPP